MTKNYARKSRIVLAINADVYIFVFSCLAFTYLPIPCVHPVTTAVLLFRIPLEGLGEDIIVGCGVAIPAIIAAVTKVEYNAIGSQQIGFKK